MDQRILVENGMYQRILVETGMYQRILVETGMYQDVQIVNDNDTRMYQTRLSTTSDEVEIQTNPVEQVQVRVLAKRFEEDLGHVFP